VRDFAAGSDPRRRDQVNVRLLTGGADYDALFVADARGDFFCRPRRRHGRGEHPQAGRCQVELRDRRDHSWLLVERIMAATKPARQKIVSSARA
jgi:hypothetical protein